MNETNFDLPTGKEQTESRNYIGWIVLAAMFAYTIFGALSAYLKPGKGEKSYTQEIMQYEQAISATALTDAMMRFAQPATKESKELEKSTTANVDRQREQLIQSLDPTISRLAQMRTKDIMAAKLFASMRTEQGKKIQQSDIELVEKSTTQNDQAFFYIYTADKLTRIEAEALSSQITDKSFLGTMAKVHAYEKAGDMKYRQTVIQPQKAFAMAIFMFGACTGLVIAMFVWMVYFNGRTTGKIEVLGLPLGMPSMRFSDELAMRAATLFFLFIAGNTLLEPIFATLKLGSSISNILFGCVMIGLSFMVIRLPIAGHRLEFHEVGLSTKDFAKNVIWGFTGYVANLPLVGLAMLIGLGLMQNLPTMSHPLNDEFLKNPDALKIGSLMFLACVVAPIWEEIMFRGLLFPALGRPMGGIVGAAMTSSLLFAMIHPQGIPAWLALATVAGMNCALVNHTRSLVPAITLHAIHNFVLLVLSVAISL